MSQSTKTGIKRLTAPMDLQSENTPKKLKNSLIELRMGGFSKTIRLSKYMVPLCDGIVRKSNMIIESSNPAPNAFGNIIVDEEKLSDFSSKQAIEKKTNISNDAQKIKIENNGYNILELMYKESLYTDLILISETEHEFQAHRSVLAAQSPILREIFLYNKSSCTLKLELKDFASQTIEEMLRFLYTGQVFDGGEKNVINLLKIAKKYAIDLLHTKCQIMLLKYLTVNNATNLLTLSDIHGSNQLQEGTIGFITKNIDKFSRDQLMKINSNAFYAEILIQLTKKA